MDANSAKYQMTTIVNDLGFVRNEWSTDFLNWDEINLDIASIGPGEALDVPNTLSGEELIPAFENIALIRIAFPAHTDGRGFTLARRLRLLGYRGRLRAHGHLLADQYSIARRCGFDEVEIDAELARRQPENQWRLNSDWSRFDYQSRLRQPG